MSKIVFIQLGDTRQLELKIDGDSTWMNVTDEFVSFLQGCGYQVTGADVADYLTEVYSEVDYSPEEIFDFGLADYQYQQNTMAGDNISHNDVTTTVAGDVTLNDVMHMWGQSTQAESKNTITITTR